MPAFELADMFGFLKFGKAQCTVAWFDLHGRGLKRLFKFHKWASVALYNNSFLGSGLIGGIGVP